MPFTARINADGIDLLEQVSNTSIPSGPPSRDRRIKLSKWAAEQPKNEMVLIGNNDLFEIARSIRKKCPRMGHRYQPSQSRSDGISSHGAPNQRSPR